MSSRERWMVVGEIVGSFGVRGEVKVDLRTDFPERFASMSLVYVGEEHRQYVILTARPHGRQVLLRLEGVDSPEAASGLRGRELSVPRSDAVALPEGHYYLDEIVGATVVSTAGQPIGQVTDVLRTGSNDVFVVGRGRDEVLIPSTREAIEELDLEKRRIVVHTWVLEL